MPDIRPPPNHAARDHARFSPSAAKRWLNCPGSVPLIESLNIERVDNAASTFGNQCHQYAERVLRGELPLEQVAAIEREHVENYTRYVLAQTSFAEIEGRTVAMLVEIRLNTRIRDVWGTVDALIAYQGASGLVNEIEIVDLKTGREIVEAEENEQLLTYAVGALTMFPSAIKFRLVIAQATDPERPIKVWECSRDRVQEHRGRIRAAIRDLSVMRMGDWCQWCPARTSVRCPLHREAAVAVFDLIPANVPAEDTQAARTLIHQQATELTTQQRQFVLTHRAAIERFMDAVVADAMRAPPPGWKVVRARGRATWRRDLDVQAACDRLGVSPRLTMPTIGDARRQSLMPLDDLITTPEGRPTIVPEDDPRPAISGGDVFIEQEDE